MIYIAPITVCVVATYLTLMSSFQAIKLVKNLTERLQLSDSFSSQIEKYIVMVVLPVIAVVNILTLVMVSFGIKMLDTNWFILLVPLQFAISYMTTYLMSTPVYNRISVILKEGAKYEAENQVKKEMSDLQNDK